MRHGSMRLVAAPFLVAMFCASGLHAASPPPAPPVFAPAGAKLTWSERVNGVSRGGTITIAGQDGLIGKYRNKKGEARQVLVGCQPCFGATSAPEGFDALWPLAVGNVVSYELDTPDKRLKLRSEVVAAETVTLASGAFETFVIETTGGGGLVSRSWYAPSVGWVVRVHETAGSGYSYDGEVVAIERP